jgi:hypothetical protein
VCRLLLCGGCINDNEIVYVCGSRVYSATSGYANSLRYVGSHVDDDLKTDLRGRYPSRVICMDAIKFEG